MKEKLKASVRSHFTATNIAYMALFTALAFAVTFLEFSLFPGTPAYFLKFDFANVFFLIEGFIFGPVEAIFSIGVKELLCWTKSSTGGVGELANFLMSVAYVIVPSVAYRFKKGRGWVALYLFCACLAQIGAGMLVNRFINFPAFGALWNFDGVAMFYELWPFVIYFNIIKSVGISLVVLLIYKPLSRVIRYTAEKVAARRRRAVASASGGEKLAEKEENPPQNG